MRNNNVWAGNLITHLSTAAIQKMNPKVVFSRKDCNKTTMLLTLNLGNTEEFTTEKINQNKQIMAIKGWQTHKNKILRECKFLLFFCRHILWTKIYLQLANTFQILPGKKRWGYQKKILLVFRKAVWFSHISGMNMWHLKPRLIYIFIIEIICQKKTHQVLLWWLCHGFFFWFVCVVHIPSLKPDAVAGDSETTIVFECILAIKICWGFLFFLILTSCVNEACGLLCFSIRLSSC